MLSNLPPGCSDSDIPGNRPEDVALEDFHDKIDADCVANEMTITEAHEAWSIGLSEFMGLKR